MSLKAVIIEDEESSRITLQNMVHEFCQNIKIVNTAENITDGVAVINEHKPDILFLDIEMPKQNGFQIFEHFPEPEFEVIFTTAYENFALKALKLSAIDYLLKPIDLQELRLAISKVQEKKENTFSQSKIISLQQNLNNQYQKLVLPTTDGYSFIELPELLRCEAQGNYTMFFLKNGEKILVSKTLKIYSEMLEEFNFFRISRSQLVNLNHIRKFGRQKSPTVTLTDETVLTVSIYRRNDFIKRIECLK